MYRFLAVILLMGWACSSGSSSDTDTSGTTDSGNSADVGADVLSANLPSCDPHGIYDPTSLNIAAAEYAFSLPDDATECGCVYLPPEDNAAALQSLQCLCDAWASCSYAHFRFITNTIEGDPIADDYFIRPNADSGCEVIHLTDWSQDAFGGVEGVSTDWCGALQCDASQMPPTIFPDECHPLN
ncbi:MAG: hypothetical protein CMH54_01370 [Myxococcales bacterium]|nr:hypothetical protein [Myxococcales bacterium]|tara:strand:- start:3207 stop:3758 length:552 start_codon:yes stop_codon:yes gene_type:complete